MKLDHLLRSKRIVESWYVVNDGTRTLFESAVNPEVEKALKDWSKAKVKDAVLIGGMAISFWGLPRHTQDADFLFLTSGKIPNSIEGFKKSREHAFQHKQTHVEIEVLDPDFLKISHELVQKIYDTSVEIDHLKVASKSGLIASKLNRFSRQDQADMETLIKLGDIDLTEFTLTEIQRSRFEKIFAEVEAESKS